jgi:hypothetical protein
VALVTDIAPPPADVTHRSLGACRIG